jgi:Peptidase family M1 domain
MPRAQPRPSPPGALAAVLVAVLALLPGAAVRAAQVTESKPPAGKEDASAFLTRIEAAWQTRDLAAWTALWDFASPEQREEEEEVARAAFGADETGLSFLRPPSPAEGADRFTADVQVFSVKEPRGQIAYWRLVAERRGDRWALVSRSDTGLVDGLIHLSLGHSAWRAHGVSLHLEDFELRLEDGTLYANAEDVGPTAFVFVGRGRVRFEPRPPAEREQLRQFSKQPAMDHRIDWAFFRLHPADFNRVLDTALLEPDPDPLKRHGQAERVWRERSERTHVVDAPLPRSPWWLMPNPGDAVVDFPWGHRVLSFVMARSEPEDVNLFDRDRRLQICSYPSGGRRADYREDEGRAVDVLEHVLTVRFDPAHAQMQATHSMRLKLLGAPSTLRLRLDDDLRVSSVSLGDGTRLLFMRVRDQDSIVISLGPLVSSTEPFTLTTRYAGRHDPASVEQELAQVLAPPDTRSAGAETFVTEPPLVYSNRTAWYPRPASEEFAPMRAVFETPEDWLAVTGGDLVSEQREAGRVRVEYRLEQPGKFFTTIVGRLQDVGLRQEGEQAVRGFATARTRGEMPELMTAAQQILGFYAERFGPCPYPRLNLAVAEARTPGGHSPPGLLYLQERPLLLRAHPLPEDPANFSDLRDFFLAHEAAHQWWGQGVAPANYRERWLSEAWAQYAAALWIRSRQGEGAFRHMMDRMASWAERFDAMGPIHLGYRLGHLVGDPRIFRAIVYDKGAWVLHMLRGLVGDEAFFQAARAFLEQHRYSWAGTADLRAALEQASGRDLGPYFERWIYDTGLPRLVWAYRTEGQDGGFRTTVEVRPQLLPGPLPLEIAVVAGGRREARIVTLPPTGGSWTFDTAQKPAGVEINEDRGLLAQEKRVRRIPPAH